MIYELWMIIDYLMNVFEIIIVVYD